jgi:amidase
MGRTVADVAALLAVLVAADDADPASAQAKSHAAPDYTAFLNPGALAGKRIGLVRQALGFNADVDAAIERAVETMTTAGAIVIDVQIQGYRDWEDPEMVVLLYEFKSGINAYLKAAGVKPGSLAELIEWNGNHRDTVMPWFGQELFEKAQAKGSLKDAAYREARAKARKLAGENGLFATLDANRVDVLMVPSAGPAWTTDLLLGDHYAGGGGAAMAAIAGTPSITVPMGESHGLPLGLALMGAAYSEAQLIGLAYAFEQASHARTPPKYVATLPVTTTTTAPKADGAH